MSFSLNHVMLAGNLTRDPTVRTFASDRSVAEFGLAVNRRFKTADGQQKEEVTFVDVEAWGRTAELVGQYLTKGSPCYIEGRLKLDSWQDKEGQKRSKLKVVADSVQFLGSPKHGDGDKAGPTGAGDAGAHATIAQSPVEAVSSDLGHDEPPF